MIQLMLLSRALTAALLLALAAGCGSHSSNSEPVAKAANPASPPVPAPTTPAAPTTFAGIELGIFPGADAPFPSSEFLVSGRWAGVIDGRAQVLYVGEDAQHPGAGRANVMLYQGSASLVSGHSIALPKGTKALRVIAYGHGKVLLRSRAGRGLTYDPTTQRVRST